MTQVITLDKVLEEVPEARALELMQNLKAFCEREQLREDVPDLNLHNMALDQREGENALHSGSPVYYGGSLAKIPINGEPGFYEYYLLIMPQRGAIVPEKHHFRILPDKELGNIILDGEEFVYVLSGVLGIIGEDVKRIELLPAGTRRLSYSCTVRCDGSIDLFQDRHALYALQDVTGMIFSRLMIPYSEFEEGVDLDLYSEQINELKKRSKELYGVEL